MQRAYGRLRILFNISFLLLVIVWCGITVNEVKAANADLITDTYTISVGDRVYLPYLANPSKDARFMIIKDKFNHYTGMYDEIFALEQEDMITGKKKGEGRVLTMDDDGEIYDGMALYVTERPILTLSGTTSIGMQIGQVGRSFAIKPLETNSYHFSVSGSNYLEVWVYSENYGTVIGHVAGTNIAD